jgi:hypothetical protein
VGDEARAVRQYLRERGETRVRSFSATSSCCVLRRSTLVLANAEGKEPEHTRYVAIGASFLNGSTGLRRSKFGQIGH